MLESADNKHIVIQELGMHNDSSSLNSSETKQAEFFDQFFAFMEETDQVRAAFVFQLVNWSTEVVEIFNRVFEAETPDWFIEQYGQVVQSIGLINYKNGKKKKAYETFIKWIFEFQ